MSDLPPSTEAIFRRFIEEITQAPANGRNIQLHVKELTDVAKHPVERMRFANLCRQHINDPDSCEIALASIRKIASDLDGIRHHADTWTTLFEKVGFGAGIGVFVGAVLKIVTVTAASNTVVATTAAAASVFAGPVAFAIYGVGSLLTAGSGFAIFRWRSRKLKNKIDSLQELTKLMEKKFSSENKE